MIMAYTEYGLRFDKTEILDQDLLHGLPEADYMRFNLFTIRLGEECKEGGDEEEEKAPHFEEP